jgi:hypothetical protein
MGGQHGKTSNGGLSRFAVFKKVRTGESPVLFSFSLVLGFSAFPKLLPNVF